MISSFRQATPKRRLNRKVCKDYGDYKNDLRTDFNKRCGYCNDSDKLRIRSFTIDHFVPQKPKGFSHSIPSNDYYNLVYSCRYCNSSKTNKWPTMDPAVHNDGIKGFVDPTNDDYSSYFQRSKEGRIVAFNPADAMASYLINELNLWLTVHERMWKLEKFLSLHLQIKTRLATMTDMNLKKQLEEVHYRILLELVEIQQSIFVEND